MPELERKTFFMGNSEVSPDDVGLTLSPDNRCVIGSTFLPHGCPDLPDAWMTCDQIWPEALDSLTLTIKLSSLNPFTFGTGGLWSDLMSSDNFTHGFHERASNHPILGTPVDKGVGEFCLRMVCQISSTSSGRRGIMAKFMILLFPASAEDLAITPEAQLAGWPGLEIADGVFPLSPRPSEKWGCPLLPNIRPGAAFADLDVAPASDRLRHAVAAVILKVAQPEAARSGGVNLLTRWDQVRANPCDLSNKTPATTWRPADPIMSEDGEYLKVMSSEKVGGSRVTSTLGTWYGGVVMGVLFSFNEAAILYRDFNSAPLQQQNIINGPMPAELGK